MQRQQIWMSITLIFFVVMSSIYANIVPRFEASDEAEHFIYTHVILETGELPRIQSRIDMANQTDPILRWNNQSHHAPLYYLLGSALISWTDRSDLASYLTPNELIFLRDTVEDNPNKWLHRYGEPTGQTHIALYILRAFNILIGVGTLIMVYLAATHTHKERVIAPLAMLFTALIPTFIIVNASVTNDALTIFLYSAGVYWLLRVWRREKITWRDTAIISLILAGISLTKLTGVTLFGVIYLGVFAGMLRKKWTWRTVLQVGIVSALAFVLLAGWWYLRNYNIYGDPLAQAATASIWGRMEGITLAEYGDNLVRIAMSFWMMIGYLHQPVFLPHAFYWYCAVLTLAGIVGAIVYAYQATGDDRDIMFILAGVCIVVAALLLYGTLSVDISYGRLLLPAIAAFAPLTIIGLYNFINGWRIPLGIFVPLLISVLMTPFLVTLSYSNIQAVSDVPDSAQRIGWQNGNLEIVAVDTQPADAGAGDTIYVDIYFRGNHPDNPALTVTAVDTIQVQRFDHIEIFPGMADMRHLPDDQLYRTTVLLDIPQPQTSLPPRVVNILIEWIDLETNTHLVFDSGTSLLELQSATFVDSTYNPPNFANRDHIFFGDEIIALDDWQVPESASAGETVELAFVWEALRPIDADYTLTLQVFDADNNLVAQNDGILWWYPTSAWAEAVPFEDRRTLELPADLPVGGYEIRVGWYRDDGETYPRLSVDNAVAVDSLYTLPQPLIVTE